MKNDLSVLQGRWVQIEYNSDGVDNPIDEFKQNPEVVINGNEFTVLTSAGDMIISGTFRIDQEAHPKSIDWTDRFGPDEGKTFPGIYTLHENELLFCAANENMNRPDSYEPGCGLTIRRFKRLIVARQLVE